MNKIYTEENVMVLLEKAFKLGEEFQAKNGMSVEEICDMIGEDEDYSFLSSLLKEVD